MAESDLQSLSGNLQVKLENRDLLNQSTLKSQYGFIPQQTRDVKETVKQALRSKCNPGSVCTATNIWKFTTNRVPLLKWAPKYNVRGNLGNDILAGLTVGVIHIPQGMAYALVAKVSPVVGLYVSFFPALVFFLFGTSQHVSIGGFAVGSIMLGKIVDDVLARRPEIIPDLVNSTGDWILDGNSTLHVDLEDDLVLMNRAAIEIAVAVCFVVGLVQLALGFLQLGIFSVYLSDVLVSGFSTGSAVHILTSQVKNIFGVAVRSRSGPLKIFYAYYDIFCVIHETNYVSVIMFVSTFACLDVVNRFVNPKFRARFKFLIPIELLTMIFATMVAHFAKLNAEFGLKVIGTIPTGIPPPRLIKWYLVPEVFVDTIPIAVISFTVVLSMSKLFGKKGGYKINANQDLLAVGASNAIAAFFSCYPCSAAISRTIVQYSSGGKTQIASLVSCVFVMVIILFIGPLFRQLPHCVLSAILVFSIQGMLQQFKDFKNAWDVCRPDAIIWLITFLGVVLLDVDKGIGIGLAALIFSNVLRSQSPKSCLLGRLPRTEIYVDVEKFSTAEEQPGVKVFRFYAAPYFANKDFFRKELFRLVGINPVDVIAKRRKVDARRSRKSEEDDAFNERIAMANRHSVDVNIQEVDIKCAVNLTEVNAVVVDCSNWNCIDSAGINVILQVIEEYKAVDISVFLAGCLDPIMETMENHPLYADVCEPRMFPTVADVLVHISPEVFLRTQTLP